VVIASRRSEKRCAAFGWQSATDNAAIITELLHTKFQFIGVVSTTAARIPRTEQDPVYCLFANCADNPLALVIDKRVIQPIVSDCSSKGPLGSDGQIVGIPIRKSTNREELGFRTIAVFRGAGQ